MSCSGFFMFSVCPVSAIFVSQADLFRPFLKWKMLVSQNQMSIPKVVRNFALSLAAAASLLTSALPCGPSLMTPLFTLRGAPEHPYRDYAAGRLGIIKPEFHRSVLFAAYRWINGAGLTPEQQQAMIDVWNADFRNRDYVDNDITEAVDAWIEKRKAVAGKDEKLPDIYVEREYGGYDFFPNCTRNAFETATETLSSRIASYGSDHKDVKAWLSGQDAVFSNCSGGKTMPVELLPGAADWLQKDRAYQMAAASFYSLDYERAKERFREIAQDFQSPWQETANYLVARTLIRRASLSKDSTRSKKYYTEAEEHLNRFSGGGKFAESAERLLSLIKYRIHPEQRVRELAQKLSAGGSSDFRQDVIDYTWLLDKFESRALEELAKQKEKERPPQNTESIISSGHYSTTSNVNAMNAAVNVASGAANTMAVAANSISNTNFGGFTTANTKPPTYEIESGYEGGYYSEDKPSLSILPNFLRQDDLNDWLFTYQVNNAEAYLYSLKRYKQTQSDLWLMTAISKADASSAELPRLLDAASRASRSSLAYPTVAFHQARIYLATGKNVEAKKILDDVLSRASELPVSSVNEFIKLRQSVTETLDDYLRYSLRKPYAFDYEGIGTITEFIQESKSYFNPEYHKEGQAAYEAEIDKSFAKELLWENRLMLSSETINVMNQFFPTSVLAEVEKSKVLPDYLRERFATAVWIRAAILNDTVVMNRIAPKVTQYHPELTEEMAAVVNATGPNARQNAALALIVKNPMLTPFLEDGLGRTDNEVGEWDHDDYWCEPYDEVYDDDMQDMVSRDRMKRPKFLNPAQIAAANRERLKIKRLGDAPKYLGQQVLLWAKRSPNDKRVPEALYLMVRANGWNKYGCGNNEDLQQSLARVLKTRYPNSEWAKKLISEESEYN